MTETDAIILLAAVIGFVIAWAYVWYKMER
jgi:hypothetical protein